MTDKNNGNFTHNFRFHGSRRKHKQGKKDTEPSTHSSSVNGLNSAGSSGYA